MRLTPFRATAAIAATGLVTAATIALTGTASAVSTDILVSQVYGGGGNSGATFTNDFIELHNIGSAPVDLTGWSVQYASAGGTTWQVTALSGTVAPGAYYLVQEAAGAGGTTPLPTPDATGSTAMSATSAKVALVTTTAALACGASCSTAAGVQDFIGYGTANDFETAPAPTLSNTTADARPVGAADTDNNAADFRVGPPHPRNSASPPPVPGLHTHDVQGAAHVSPYAGREVLAVPGVVTAKSGNGYWFQDPEPDADPATSEGLFVFTGSAPAVAVGDSVTVSGTVAEFRPGGSGGTTNLTTTELSGASTTVLASGQPLPEQTVVGVGGLTPPPAVIEDDATGSVETSGDFDPATDGIDFWESLEGMRVQVADAEVVGPQSAFGELPVVPAGAGVRTARGGIVLQADDANPERVILDDLLAPVPTANVGDTLGDSALGVLDYSFGNFKLLVTSSPTVTSGGLARETTRAPQSNELAVATFNVENLDPGDPQDKFDRLAAAIVTNLAAPDLVALEEVQDNTGPTDNGVVAADVTLGKLTTAITAAGGPAYQWREIDPVNDADGGEPGGNIRVVLLFRTDRELSFVDRPGGTATSDTDILVEDGKPVLSASPGRIAPTDPAWNSSRKPLAGQFRWRGKTLFVVANHFNSKGGDQPLYGRFQPPARPSETQRHAQAGLVHDFVQRIVQVDPAARVVVLGDLNDFDYSQTTDILTGGGLLTDLPRTLPLPERYTYVFEGNSQVLDHILLTPAVTRFDYDVVHVNSEFADQASDHEPQVARLRL